MCPSAPSISHLLVADDSLILIQANRENVAQLQEILQLYERVSGQTKNKEKSVLFNSNTRDSKRTELKMFSRY